MEVVGLTKDAPSGILRRMRRLPLALLGFGALAAPVRAQQVPGRDLLDFPVGVLGEAPALSAAVAGGVWNPARASVGDGRLRVSAAALNTPIEQGVSAWYVGGTVRAGTLGLASLAVVRAGVSDLLRTETDPQSLGEEIPYRTTVLSASFARRFAPMTLGLALRHRTGTVDVDRGSATSVDAGISTERVGRVPVRLAAFSFLFSPFARARERARVGAAADAPLFRDDQREFRLGVSAARTEKAAAERYVIGSARWRWLTANGGLGRERFAGASTTRLRLGFGLHYARYEVGVAREDSGAGMGPTYQFMLSSVFR